MVKVINNYTLIEKIGSGNYGEVYRALNTKKLGEFAVKAIAAQKFQQNSLLQECTVNQIKILSAIGSSQFIVKYQQHFQTKNNYYFVYEYCNGGTLMDAIKKQGHFDQKKALRIFRQLLQAFKVLNRFNIMHRDIKPQNIFFSNGKVKLGDFGFCKGLQPGQYMAKTMLGSPIYMAPQVLKGQKYSIKADIWSLGVVLYQMLFGDCPFKSNSIAMLINTINKEEVVFPLQINPVSETTLTLLKKMLTKDYFRRINWVQLFHFKIDEEGNIVNLQNNCQSSYSHSNKSLSKPKQTITNKDSKQENSLSFREQPQSHQKSEKKKKFYAQKYMNNFLQPLHQTSVSSSQRKINFFEDNVLQKNSTPDQSFQYKFYSSQKKIQPDYQKIPLFEQSKRQRMLLKHKQCIDSLKQSLFRLETRQIEAMTQSFIVLNKVQAKLKEITTDINITQTNLLDIASLVNYQIIQVGRQIVDTQHQLQRRKVQLPKIVSFVAVKSIQSQIYTPEVSPFNISLSTNND